MPLDVLFISSDSQGASTFSDEKFAYMQDKYGLSESEVRQLVFAAAPSWTEHGVPMSYVATENWARNNRQFSLSQAEIDEYFSELNNENLTRFGNGLYLAGRMLRDGHSIRVINDLGTEWNRFLKFLEEEPRMIAISTTFLESREATEATARRIRAAAPGIPIVIGGPLVLYSHKMKEESPHLFAHPQIQSTYFFWEDRVADCFDIAVIDAHGEMTLSALATRMKNGEEWRTLPNIAFPDANQRWHINPRMAEVVTLEEEGVDWAGIPDEFLGREIGIRGSRGCPLRCKFCSFVVIHPEFEVKEVAMLRDELRALATRKDRVKHISFVDDNLFLTRRSVYQYTKMMAEEKFPFTWSCFIRVDSINEENAALMKESGCNFVMLGIESGDLGVLKNMRKVQHPERILRAMEILTDAGISTLSTLVVGFPGETEESIGNTIDILNQYPDRGNTMHWFNCWVHTVIPLTPVDKQREKWDLEGILLDWKHETMDVGQAFHQRERLLKEVRLGGAYNGPYAFDSFEPFSPRGEAGYQDMRKFYKLRHRIGCLDYFGDERMDGYNREETLKQIEQIILRTSDFNRALRKEQHPEVAQKDEKEISVEGAAPTAGASVVHETHKFRPSGADS
jgi:anaerobic magnesium-protoporphyrin IX monomethyl ester cyclase